MENSKATINVYDYNKPKSSGRKLAIFISKLVEDIVLLLVIGVIIYSAYKFLNKDAIGEIDNMTISATSNLHNYVTNSVDEDMYVLNFPDTNNIVSTNGKLNNNNGLDLNTFEEGYIRMYKDGSYTFRLKYNGYCISKKVDDKKYSVTILLPCKTKEY